MKNNFIIEVCAAHLQSAIAAQEGGAKRIELCDNLYEGGTTPSYAAIKLAREKITIDLYIMIRPRGGDFCYSDLEFGMMKEDILMCKQLGADGVVFGILLPDGNVDILRSKILVELASPMSITFHRAFDMTPDPFRALEDIISIRAQRILTAGQKNKAAEGLELIKRLVDRGGNRINIMPGSGINESNINELKNQTGANEFHLTARETFESKMTFRKEGIYMGGLEQIPEYLISMTSRQKIERIITLVNS